MSDSQEENSNQSCQNRFSHRMLVLASLVALLVAAFVAFTNHTLDMHDSELTELQDTMDRIYKEMVNFKAKSEKYKAEKAVAVAQQSDADSQLEAAREAVQASNSELAQVRAQFASKNNDVNTLLADLVMGKEALAERERALETAMKSLSEQLKLNHDYIQKVSEVESRSIPVGTILAFKGDHTRLRKQGWALCDGTTPTQQGISDATLMEPTPNLKSRFLRVGLHDKPTYIGCSACESSFITSPKKTKINYFGGESYWDSLHTAKKSGQRYFAMARDGDYGHMFTFDTLDETSLCQANGGGCNNPCKDAPYKFCGCAGGSCGSHERDPVEPSRLRRWAVYDLGEKYYQRYYFMDWENIRLLDTHEMKTSDYEVVYIMLVK